MIKEVVVEHAGTIWGIPVKAKLVQVHKWEVEGIGPERFFYQRCPHLDGHFLVEIEKVRLEGNPSHTSWRVKPEDIPDDKQMRKTWLIEQAISTVKNYLAMVKKFAPWQLDGLQLELF